MFARMICLLPSLGLAVLLVLAAPGLSYGDHLKRQGASESELAPTMPRAKDGEPGKATSPARSKDSDNAEPGDDDDFSIPAFGGPGCPYDREELGPIV